MISDKCGFLKLFFRDPISAIESVPYGAVDDERDFAMFLVSVEGGILYRLPGFQDDKEIVTKACENNPRAIKYASDRLKSDIDLAALVLAQKPYLIHEFNDDIKDKLNRKIAS